MARRLRSLTGSVAAVLLSVASATVFAQSASPPDVDPLRAPDTQLEPIEWSTIPGWDDDDHAEAFTTFRTSCNPFLARRATHTDTRPIYVALKEVCKRAAAAGALGADKQKAREFFEENFRPVRISKLGESKGLLTGYYEPIVDGTRLPNPEFHAPLYRRPSDLLVAGKKAPKGSFPNRAPVNRLNEKNELVPYYERLEIEDGALDGQHLELCWLRDPWVAMTIQIQGSARVVLEDGTMLRLNYDAHNGHSYTSVGRILIERGLIPREEMTMDRITQWMARNPDLAKEVRGTNKSFVFFRITGLNDDTEPVGAQGVRLTPWRSIAVDRIHVYGTPFFIEADLPIDSPRPTTKFRRLMVAQDTGSAIIGPARADLYFGAGLKAGRIAGRIRQQGRFVMLLPKELDMVEAGKAMPLPPPRPVAGDFPPPKSKAKDKAKKKQPGKGPEAKAKSKRGS